MQDKVTYEFAVIRIVPKVEREEFLNIGVILFSKPKDFLSIKYFIDEKRISAFSEAVEIDLIRNHLNSWEFICIGDVRGGKIGKLETASRFRWLTASKSTIIQTSKTHSGLCDDPEKVLEDLFQLYVL